MKVKLLTAPEFLSAMEHNAAYAMLTCHANTDLLKEHEAHEFVLKAIKAEHGTILEHMNFTFEVRNLSRACLQELARHRHLTLSVESTRHTLRKKVGIDESIIVPSYANTGITFANPRWGVETQPFIDVVMKMVCMLIIQCDKTSNDVLKYYIPEFWPTNLVLTANARELRHVFKLRTAPAALKEFRDLCYAMFEAVPENFRYLFEDCIYKEENTHGN